NLALAFNNRGIAYEQKGDLDRAIQDFDQAIKLKRNYVGALNNRANIYDRKGDVDRAIQDYSEAIRLNPKVSGFFINRGRAYLRKNENDRAVADFNDAVRLLRIPQNFAAANGDPAEVNYDRAIANVLASRGTAYQAKGDDERAIQDFDEAVRLLPTAETFVSRGRAYAAKDID